MANMNPKKALALLLVGGTIMIAVNYKDVVNAFGSDPVPFLLLPVIAVVAWFIWKLVSPHLDKQQGQSGNKPNDENW